MEIKTELRPAHSDPPTLPSRGTLHTLLPQPLVTLVHSRIPAVTPSLQASPQSPRSTQHLAKGSRRKPVYTKAQSLILSPPSLPQPSCICHVSGIILGVWGVCVCGGGRGVEGSSLSLHRLLLATLQLHQRISADTWHFMKLNLWSCFVVCGLSFL